MGDGTEVEKNARNLLLDISRAMVYSEKLETINSYVADFKKLEEELPEDFALSVEILHDFYILEMQPSPFEKSFGIVNNYRNKGSIAAKKNEVESIYKSVRTLSPLMQSRSNHVETEFQHLNESWRSQYQF